MDLRSALDETTSQLRGLTDAPELDAQVLLAHVTGTSRSWVVSHPDSLLSDLEAASARRALSALQAGTPLPYLLGHWKFFGLDFDLTPDVLIPRPETELLVERAIAWLQAHPNRRQVADIGTGSGAIAISVAAHVPDARFLATDISVAALEVAKHNAQKFNLHDRIKFLECDLFSPSSFIFHLSSFDLICANLPYIPTETLRGLPIFGREPSLALDGGPDGLNLIRRLLQIAPEWLAPRGLILLETEASLGMPTLSLAYDRLSDATIHLHQDLSGKDRLVEIALK